MKLKKPYGARRRITTLAALAAAASLMLFGCASEGADSPDSPVGNDDAASADQQPDGAGEPITLKFTRSGDSATIKRIFDPIIAEFEALHSNVTIESIEMGFDEANERMPLLAATGELPDVVSPPDSLSATLAQDGAFLEIGDLISDELKSDIPPSMFEAPSSSTPDGTVVGVPANVGVIVLWYNADVFKAAGLDPDKPPVTWDEFREYAQQIEDNTDADGLGLNGFARNDVDDMFAAVVASRTDGQWYWDNDANTVTVNDANADALDFLGGLVADGLTQPSVDTYNRADTRALIRDGKVGMTFDGPWLIGSLGDDVDVDSPDSPYRTAPLPGSQGVGALNLQSWNISAATEHPEMAMEFVEFLSSAEHSLTHAREYGVLPPRISLLQSDEFSSGPWPALAEVASGNLVPAKPGLSEISIIETDIPSMVQSVLLGQASGMDALEQLAVTLGNK